jgi:hypothetical protein
MNVWVQPASACSCSIPSADGSSGEPLCSLCEHRLEAAESGTGHSLLQARAGAEGPEANDCGDRGGACEQAKPGKASVSFIRRCRKTERAGADHVNAPDRTGHAGTADPCAYLRAGSFTAPVPTSTRRFGAVTAAPIDILYERSLSSYRHSIGERRNKRGKSNVVEYPIRTTQFVAQATGRVRSGR